MLPCTDSSLSTCGSTGRQVSMQTLQWNYTELFSFSEAQLFLYIDFSIFNEARQNVTFRFFEL